MSDLVIDPPSSSVPDEQSPHLGPIRDNTPGWYTDGLAGRKTELATLDLSIPDWYKKASATAKGRLKEIHGRSRQSLNQLDQMFSELKSPADYAEPLLVAAIEKKFGKRLDVRNVFYARKMGQKECKVGPDELSTSSVSALASEFYFYRGVSLLDAALNNFTLEESSAPVCQDCHVITDYNFYQDSFSKIHVPANVRVLKLDIKAFEFAGMCRDLDLGYSYFEHVRSIINAHIEKKTPSAPTGKLYSSLITSHRNQLELAAEIALMKGDIQNNHYALLKEILINQTGRKWGSDDVTLCRLRLCTFVVENILIIGPVVWRINIRNAENLPRPCMVYIPGDPLHPLKAYDNIATFTDHLTTRLCRAEYRKFFSQFVPLSNQDAFFTQIKALLDPREAYTTNQDFAPAFKSRIYRQGTYAPPWRDLWLDSAMQRIRVIMENASASAVSTKDVTDRAYNAWLWSWGSTALDILNLASFVVPFLGEVMLAVAAVQMIYEVSEGIEAWSEGDARMVWAHFSAVGLNLAGLAVPKVLMAAKESVFIKRLVHVEFGGRARLYDFNPGEYKHQITLPGEDKPNVRGLYAHEGHMYLPATGGGHYRVQATETGNDFKLIHPDGNSRYAPRLRHNGEGAWVHEFERPMIWDRKTLLRRVGHSVEHLSDSQLEQVRVMSGVSDGELRRVFIDHQRPPPLFSEVLRRFECARKHQVFIDQLSSADPEVFGRVDSALQMKLLLDSGAWPESRMLAEFDDQGYVAWSSAKVTALTRNKMVKLNYEQASTGIILPSLLSQLSEPEIQELLDEKTIELDVRSLLIITGRIRRELFQTPTENAVDNKLVEQMMSARRTPAARALRYRDRLLELAKSTRGKLFNLEISAGDISSDTNVQLVQRSFPGLPKLVAEEMVAHASSQELAHMGDTARLPLRLAEEARYHLQKARVMRAHTDLLFDNDLTMDGVHLALHKLASIPERLDGVCIELRADTYGGPLLGRVGQVDAPKQLRLIRINMKEWALRSGPDKIEYWRSDKDAFYSALWLTGKGKLTDWKQLKSDTQILKTEIAQQPLSEPATREALGLQVIKPGFKSPMRLADGRIGYPLSPVAGAAQRPFVCVMKAMTLYPSKSFEEVEELFGLQGLGDVEVLAKLSELEQELKQLDSVLTTWQQEGGSGYRRSRSRVSNTIKYAWQRCSPQALAADQTPIGHILDLSDEVIGELPPMTANMDHVGSLVLRRMGLSDNSLSFLKPFGGLRWLNMSENNVTQLPDFANDGAALTKLNLSRNDIQLTEQSRVRLEGMQSLKILNLSDNRRLGWVANLRRLRSLNQLYLGGTGTTTFPAGAEQLTTLARIDLHSNQITTLPEYAYQHLDRINVHENPLSVITRERLQLDVPLNQAQWADHVTVLEARDLWLCDLPATEQAHHSRTWDEVRASPDSAAFFTVLADTTRCAEYVSVVTRPALAERVWDMLEAAGESQGIRESLFKTADDRITCGDGSSIEFMNLESELMASRALELAGVEDVESSLITTARKLFRLKLVDAIAQRDVDARGPVFTEQVEVILAYRTRLADRLGLPVKSRGMLFPHQANVSQVAIDEAYAQVLKDESIAGDESAFFAGREFWEKHLRSQYPQELKALMAPGIDSVDEKSAALFELADLQGEQDNNADQATKDQWQTKHNAVVTSLVSLLGKRKDEILVNGSMQSAFFENQLKLLSTVRHEQERRALQVLTRRVLNNFAAMEGTQV